MREFTYENQGTSTWLICDLSAEKIDTMSLGMITNNKITGIVPALYMQQDRRKYLKYNISAKISLKQFFMGTVSKKRLLGVFTGIVSALMAAEEYMIDINSILLDTEYIFADVSSGKAEVICVPVMEEEQPVRDIGAFFKNIMFSTQFDSGEDCDYVARIINYLNSAPVLSLPAFGSLLQELENMTMVLTDRKPLQEIPATEPETAAEPKPESMVRPPVWPQQKMPVQPNLQPQPVISGGMLPKGDGKTSVSVPPVAIPPAVTDISPAQPATEAGGSEKEISLFYLLQHYSKENAAAYKAQKNNQKEKKKQKPAKEKKAPKSSKSGKESKQPSPIPQMQIPGAGAALQPSAVPQPAAPTLSQIQVPSQPPVSSPVQPQPPHMTLQDISYGAQSGISGSLPQSGTGASIARYGAQASVRGNFGETTVLSAAGVGETTVLSAVMTERPLQAYLFRVKTGEQILLNKPVFRVGKERSFVDYFIGDNTAISRSHANFISHDGAYFVEDTNSTNHTFVNGMMIPSNTENALTHGDRVRLADEEFEFRMI